MFIDRGNKGVANHISNPLDVLTQTCLSGIFCANFDIAPYDNTELQYIMEEL